MRKRGGTTLTQLKELALHVNIASWLQRDPRFAQFGRQQQSPDAQTIVTPAALEDLQIGLLDDGDDGEEELLYQPSTSCSHCPRGTCFLAPDSLFLGTVSLPTVEPGNLERYSVLYRGDCVRCAQTGVDCPSSARLWRINWAGRAHTSAVRVLDLTGASSAAGAEDMDEDDDDDDDEDGDSDGPLDDAEDPKDIERTLTLGSMGRPITIESDSDSDAYEEEELVESDDDDDGDIIVLPHIDSAFRAGPNGSGPILQGSSPGFALTGAPFSAGTAHVECKTKGQGGDVEMRTQANFVGGGLGWAGRQGGADGLAGPSSSGYGTNTGAGSGTCNGCGSRTTLDSVPAPKRARIKVDPLGTVATDGAATGVSGFWPNADHFGRGQRRSGPGVGASPCAGAGRGASAPAAASNPDPESESDDSPDADSDEDADPPTPPGPCGRYTLQIGAHRLTSDDIASLAGMDLEGPAQPDEPEPRRGQRKRGGDGPETGTIVNHTVIGRATVPRGNMVDDHYYLVLPTKSFSLHMHATVLKHAQWVKQATTEVDEDGTCACHNWTDVSAFVSQAETDAFNNCALLAAGVTRFGHGTGNIAFLDGYVPRKWFDALALRLTVAVAATGGEEWTREIAVEQRRLQRAVVPTKQHLAAKPRWDDEQWERVQGMLRYEPTERLFDVVGMLALWEDDHGVCEGIMFLSWLMIRDGDLFWTSTDRSTGTSRHPPERNQVDFQHRAMHTSAFTIARGTMSGPTRDGAGGGIWRLCLLDGIYDPRPSPTSRSRPGPGHGERKHVAFEEEDMGMDLDVPNGTGNGNGNGYAQANGSGNGEAHGHQNQGQRPKMETETEPRIITVEMALELFLPELSPEERNSGEGDGT